MTTRLDLSESRSAFRNALVALGIKPADATRAADLFAAVVPKTLAELAPETPHSVQSKEPTNGEKAARIVLDEIAWYAADRASRAKSETELRSALESIAKVAKDGDAAVAERPPAPWEIRAAATGGGPCGTCGKPFFTHVCLSCSPDCQTPGPGCVSCRNTGMDQTPCLTASSTGASE